MSKKESKNLRPGFTTGSAAAAAAKAALTMLLGDERPQSLCIRLLTDEWISILINDGAVEKDSAWCSVIKDAGDDPDVTHKAVIGARVRILKNEPSFSIIIKGGKGVGKVTKAGLEIPPGEPAINLGPRKMIKEALADALKKFNREEGIEVEIFVPEGENLAKKTLNARLGIIGGISILGTTGIVRPLSHEAYEATIRSALSVAKAAGLSKVVMTTGRRSEGFAQKIFPKLPEEAFVQIGDFFEMSLKDAAEKKFSSAILAVFFGKAVKMAQGFPHTHAGKSALSVARLSEWTLQIAGDNLLAEKIKNANTARHAFDMLEGRIDIFVSVMERAAASAQKFAGSDLKIEAVLFDYEGRVLYRLRP